MTHFALICPPLPSHIRVFRTLGATLVARGHHVTLLLPEGAERETHAGPVQTVTFGAQAGRKACLALREGARHPTGALGVLRTVRDSARLTAILCESGPDILSRIGADAVLADQMEPAGGLIARHLGLPYLSIASALPIEREPALPPPFLDWPYDPSPDGLKRSRGAERVTRFVLRRQRRVIEDMALRFGLPGIAMLEDCISPLATISQTVAAFDFPRAAAPRLHAVGPIRKETVPDVRLPFAYDPNRPLVYCSFGTLQGHRLAMFQIVAKAAAALDMQLVIAHCGGLSEAEAASLDAHHVAAHLPERAVLKAADICVTHGGLNTVMDALGAGVPLLVLPIAFDQPGIAARVEHHGVGLKLSRVHLSERTARSSLRRLIVEKGFGERARALGSRIGAGGGARLAADIIESQTIGARAPAGELLA
ncbi:glycosyltransferase [Aureimonas mangrovi]|uniref:glycosyltransferase n=1 Tax=Aureimonas mangrovi TaxID=2758041 RepID=UPI00163D42CD|nr:glycosyltransferase [Aureimonas mangrovi]